VKNNMRKAVNKENCLAILNPELVKEWHPTTICRRDFES